MQAEHTSSFFPYLSQRFYTLVWSCLDADLHRSAVFYAERYFAMDKQSHDARHLYATALLHADQTYSALSLVNLPDARCSGCLDLKAKCCTLLGRHRQAREALEETLQDTKYTSTGFHRFPSLGDHSVYLQYAQHNQTIGLRDLSLKKPRCIADRA